MCVGGRRLKGRLKRGLEIESDMKRAGVSEEDGVNWPQILRREDKVEKENVYVLCIMIFNYNKKISFSIKIQDCRKIFAYIRKIFCCILICTTCMFVFWIEIVS